MKYLNIKESKLSHKVIAKCFGYKSVASFRNSTAHQRIMEGLDSILEITNKNNQI